MINKTVSLSDKTLKAFKLKAVKEGGSAKSHMDAALSVAATEFFQECANKRGETLEEFLSGEF